MFRGRSRCAGCGRTLSPGELVPVFSYLFSRGRCRGCGGKIPAECLWAELAGAAAFVCLGVRFGLTLELAQWLVFGGLLLAVRADGLEVDGRARGPVLAALSPTPVSDGGGYRALIGPAER